MKNPEYAISEIHSMKNELRKNCIQKRRDLSEQEVRNRSEKILKKLKKHPLFKKAKTVMVYLSKFPEVETMPLVKERLKKVIVAPKVIAESMTCCTINGVQDLHRGVFNILEPLTNVEVDPKDIDLVIVPGVVFDKRGHRIGYGRGYYDKFLKRVHCPTIGLAYDFQVIDRIPKDQWDVPVKEVLTDK